MAKYEPKTKETEIDPRDFIANIDHDRKRDEATILLEMMEKITGEEPKMWGPTIIGFGKFHYKYESGTEGDAPLLGFSPRKQSHTFYLATGFADYEEIKDLGKYKTSKACLYVNKLADIDLEVLEKVLKRSLKQTIETGQPC